MYTQTLSNLGAADIDSRLEEQLIDGILFAFQEQTSEVSTYTLIHFPLHYINYEELQVVTFASYKLMNVTT